VHLELPQITIILCKTIKEYILEHTHVQVMVSGLKYFNLFFKVRSLAFAILPKSTQRLIVGHPRAPPRRYWLITIFDDIMSLSDTAASFRWVCVGKWTFSLVLLFLKIYTYCGLFVGIFEICWIICLYIQVLWRPCISGVHYIYALSSNDLQYISMVAAALLIHNSS